jgi:lysophospholipase L1-like esterase
MSRTTRLIFCLLTLLLAGAAFVAPALQTRVARAAGPTVIMPLGDSITDGYNIPGGYRIELWQKFASNGNQVDFVGSMTNGPSSLGDKNHEGHSGWRIDQIDAQISGWLSSYQPQIVLLLIGTNDMIQEYQVAQAPARLSALIDKILVGAPERRIILATLPPNTDSGRNTRIVAYNSALPEIVAQKAAEGKLVTLVDMYSALTLADLADRTHPNQAGYSKMAAVWYAELQKFLPPGTAPPPPTSTLTPLPATPTSTLTPLPGGATFYRAFNLNGQAKTVDGNSWEAEPGAPNLTVNGSALANPWLKLSPATDPARAAALTSWRQHWAFDLQVGALPSGTYQVFVYAVQDWDNSSKPTISLSLEGAAAGTYTPGAKGSWSRLGPYTVTVTDGTLNLRTSGDIINLAAVELWKAAP